MDRLILVAVDQTLAYGAGGLPMNLVEAFQLSTTFAQAAARAGSVQQTPGAYFGRLLKHLDDVGWRVTNHGTFQQTIEPGDQTTESLAGIIERLAAGHLAIRGAPALSQVFRTLESIDTNAEPPGDLPADSNDTGNGATEELDPAALMRFWWGMIRQSRGRLGLALGSLAHTRQLTAKLALVDLTIDATPLPSFEDWDSLFAELSYDSVSAEMRYLSMSLDMQEWQAHEASVRERIGERLLEHTRRARL